MRVCLFTAYDATYEPLAILTLPLMRRYARVNGIDFRVFTEPPPGLNIYWTGVARGIELLKAGYDKVVYLDVDQMVTNDHVTPWADVGNVGFHASKDWGKDATEPWHFSMCGVVAHADTIPLYEAAIELEPSYRDKPFQEQAPMQQVVKLTGVDKNLVTIHPRRMFNAVPTAVCPGGVPEPWKFGDWCAHITMVDMGRRVKIFGDIHNALYP